MRVVQLILCITSFCVAQDVQIFQCDYLGEHPPGDTPKIFGQGTISTDLDEYNFELSPDGKTMVFARSGNIILVERAKETGGWGKPYIASFSSSFVEGEPCFLPLGTEILFS